MRVKDVAVLAAARTDSKPLAVLLALQSGMTRVKEISLAVGSGVTVVSRVLAGLQQLGLAVCEDHRWYPTLVLAPALARKPRVTPRDWGGAASLAERMASLRQREREVAQALRMLADKTSDDGVSLVVQIEELLKRHK